MDGECASLLPRVCEVLADSRRALPDDTSLEKLLDWFSGLTTSGAGGDLLESCPCLPDFISSVVKNTALDPAVLSFALKLTGLLAASEAGFKILQECSVLDLAFKHQHWQQTRLWEDPCLRIGWIQGLKNLLQHPAALDFFIKSGFMEPLLQLQTDTSLFVASAASQTLAHVLLFSSCTEEPGDERARTFIDVSAAVSQYLTESLVPRERTQLHQSLQALRLLALLLSRGGPPLRDALLQKVLDPLEELVGADHSQLTLPLMEALMAAHRCSEAEERVPDQRVSRLLASMLDSKKPPDLLLAAAAFLHRGRRDSVHTVQAARILLLPLNVITGHPLLGATDDLLPLAEHLRSKSSCISLTCVSLTNAPHVTSMPSDVLPCPPASVVSAVLSVLRICGGSSPPAAGAAELSRNLIGSSKVQKCALEALRALSNSTGVKQKVGEVFSVLIAYLDNPDSDPTVLHKSYQALEKWASVCTDLSLLTDRLKEDLAAVVGKRACDMRWEVRDSTVEFLGHLAEERGGGDPSETLLSRCWIKSLLKVALQDTESYVRASAIASLGSAVTQSDQQGATDEESEIVSQLLEILSQDTEGFARRAVVRYFIAWFSSSASQSSSTSLLSECVRTVLLRGSADLDWEVKVYTLELAELLLDQAFSGHQSYSKNSVTQPLHHPYAAVLGQAVAPLAHAGAPTEDAGAGLAEALESVVELGVVSALLAGLVDCDRPVALKACQLLTTLRETLRPRSGGPPDAVPCELPDRGWGEEIGKILRAQSGEGWSGGGGTGGTVRVSEVLASLGLDEKLDVLSRSSDHVHNSALSLLQDILTAGAAHTHAETQPGQEVIVDCY